MTETFLLELFASTSDRYIKEEVCDTLGSVGTDKTLIVLEAAYKSTRNKSLRYYIEMAIEDIRKRQAL